MRDFFQVSHLRQVLAQPSMKICLSHALCPMPNAHFQARWRIRNNESIHQRGIRLFNAIAKSTPSLRVRRSRASCS
jgi:hypothetical protein